MQRPGGGKALSQMEEAARQPREGWSEVSKGQNGVR